MTLHARSRSRGVVVFATLVLWIAGTTGCGYALVKRSDLIPPPPPRRAADSVEIVTLQRRVTAIQAQCKADSLSAAALAQTGKVNQQPPAPRPTAAQDSALQAKDDEIAALKDQLAKLTEELERIKRRLANPRS